MASQGQFLSLEGLTKANLKFLVIVNAIDKHHGRRTGKKLLENYNFATEQNIITESLNIPFQSVATQV